VMRTISPNAVVLKAEQVLK